jgi:hypothetical protein
MRDNGDAEGEAAINEMMTVLGSALRRLGADSPHDVDGRSP